MITIDQKIAELLNNWTVGDGWPVGNLVLCAIALVLAVVLCGAIGFEREWRGRSAGLRTHLLVGVGSCVVMIISIYGFPAIFGEKRDVARLAAQVITGVGFLGAGAIIHRNSGIRGLTTAGTIWAVMAIGIACGSFNFILALLATIAILIVLICFRRVETRLNKHNPTIVLVCPCDKPILEKLHVVSRKYGCEVHALSSALVENDDTRMQITYQAVFGSDESRVNEYIEALEKETDAISVQILGQR